MSFESAGVEDYDGGVYDSSLIINSKEFDAVVSKLRLFFKSKGFIEAHPQNRLSILAACEDPNTISTYQYAGEVWPLPQTGQMWLEHYLLQNPIYCIQRKSIQLRLPRNHPTFLQIYF